MTTARTNTVHANTAHATTLPGLLLERAQASADGQALRHHHLGIWEPLSWKQLADRTRNIGNGLAAIGVGERDAVGLVAVNDPRWIAADLAIQGLGAVTIAVDPGFSPGTVVTLLQTHQATTVIVGNQEQYDKVAESLTLLPLVRRIVVMEVRGIAELADTGQPSFSLNDLTVSTLAHVEQTGASSTDVWSSLVGEIDPTQTCTVEAHLDRSGPGKPTLRAHTASSADLLAAADDLIAKLEAHAGDELYPVASFADPVERALSEVMPLRVGAVLNIGEGGQLQGLEVRAVQPTIAHLPAAQLKGIRDDVERRMAKRGLRRFAVQRLLDGNGDQSVSALTDRRITFGLFAALAIAAVVVHRLLVDQHGLIRIGIIAALGAVVGAVLVVGGFGVRPFVRRAYGLAGAHSLLTSPDLDPDTRRFLGALKLSPMLEQRNPTLSSSASSAGHHQP